MTANLLESVVLEIGNLLAPLMTLESGGLLRDLGWELLETAQFNVNVPKTQAGIEVVIDKLAELGDAATEEARNQALFSLAAALPGVIVALEEEAPALVAAIEDGLATVPSAPIDPAEVVLRLLDSLTYTYIQDYHPRIFAALHILGILELTQSADDKTIKTVFWERLPAWIEEPMITVDSIYSWRSSFDGDEFLRRLHGLVRALGLPGGIYPQDDVVRQHFGGGYFGNELRIPLFVRSAFPDYYVEFGVNVQPTPSQPELDKLAGIAFYPYTHGEFDLEQELSATLKLSIVGGAETIKGIGLAILPPHELEMHTDLLSSPARAVDGHFEVALRNATQSSEPILLFNSQDGSHVGYKEIGLKLVVALQEGVAEIRGEAEVEGFTVVISTGQGDGFIQHVLSGIKLETTTDLAVGLSNIEGVYFRGSGGLNLTIPIHESIGPIRLDELIAGIGIAESLSIQLAVSFGLELGPILGTVERIGLSIPIKISTDQSGNLGPLDVQAPSFLPPLGFGLSVSAGPVGGGGYLRCDPENERYDGILQLTVGDISITVIGLITTRMPDGSPGFSLLGILAVEFDPPFSLSYNFYLSGIGGLLGLNRTFDVAEIQTRFWDGALDSIMFPHDPVANASSIISDLRAIFPPMQNRFLIAPMVAITWSYPPILRCELGILVEIGVDPIELIGITIFGQLSAILPDLDNPIVRLQLDAYGGIYLQRQELMIDANLFDSSILSLDLHGGMALRLRWGDNPYFAMSVGGFHPQVTKPPDFPSLDRMSMTLALDNPTFSLQCYFGITPNTVQFGANVEARFEAGEFNLYGHLSFDTLFEFNPFSFRADFLAEIALRMGAQELMSVFLVAWLEGPTPWHVRGVAKAQFLFVDISVDVDVSFGQPQDQPLPIIDPTDTVLEALRRNGNWQRAPGSGASGLVIFEDDASAQSSLLVDPEDPSLGYLLLLSPDDAIIIRQNVVPLAQEINCFGNAAVRPAVTYDIIVQDTGQDQALKVHDLFGHFAPGQFQALTMHERLSARDFVQCKDGIQISNDSFDCGARPASLTPGYEEKVLERERGPAKRIGRAAFQSAVVGRAAMRQAAGSRSRRACNGSRRFDEPVAKPAVRMSKSARRGGA